MCPSGLFQESITLLTEPTTVKDGFLDRIDRGDKFHHKVETLLDSIPRPSFDRRRLMQEVHDGQNLRVL